MRAAVMISFKSPIIIGSVLSCRPRRRRSTESQWHHRRLMSFEVLDIENNLRLVNRITAVNESSSKSKTVKNFAILRKKFLNLAC